MASRRKKKEKAAEIDATMKRLPRAFVRVGSGGYAGSHPEKADAPVPVDEGAREAPYTVDEGATKP
ncbi:MAG TPA: hypothetical protein VF407_20865 [Polyangiaceae bacterium]